VEALESRSLLSVALSIGDASAIEGGSALKFIDHFVAPSSGGLATPRCSIFGPDGKLYVVSGGTNAVLRYDGVTGAFLDTFVGPGSGGLNNPNDLAFGPGGDLYVSSSGSNQVLRYDGASGAFLDVGAGLLASPCGITFGSDGSLYIAAGPSNEVLRKDSSGLAPFVTAGSGGLSRPRKAVFGPDGNLYVASANTSQVLRYSGLTGAFIDVFASTDLGQGPNSGPGWLEFGADGYLYATATIPPGGLNSTIIRFNATTGAFVDAIAPSPGGWAFNLGPGNLVYDSGTGAGNFVDRYGPSSVEAFTVSLSAASSSPVSVSYATADGTALAGRDYNPASGTLTFVPGVTTQTILVQTLDDGTSGPTRSFTVNLANPLGATLARAQGTGTLLECDSTKFYVGDAGSTDATYRYGISGNAMGSSALAAGDTAPRGIASNAAGTTVWVADANKNVYVYSPSGGLLGSWSAGSLNAQARVEGIATNGTDIWLVDAKQAKVFKYAGAASRTTGSQNAASSFNLTSSDTAPKDIVTDGSSFWMVDANKTVYKYTLTGRFLGSWALDSLNTQPTGITINPNNVSDLWIVDNGTLKVYQYTAAAPRTSGSQNASAIFALSPSDTNPQAIADPPPAELVLRSSPAPLGLPPSSAAVVQALSTFGPPILLAVSSLASRDAAFTLLLHESPQHPGEQAVEALGGTALTSHRESPAPPHDYSTVLPVGSGQAADREHTASYLLDAPWADDGSPASSAGTDSLFAALAIGRATEQ
jgi:hypothetical protein